MSSRGRKRANSDDGLSCKIPRNAESIDVGTPCTPGGSQMALLSRHQRKVVEEDNNDGDEHLATAGDFLKSKAFPVIEEKLGQAVQSIKADGRYRNLGVLHSRTEFRVVKGLYMEVKIYNAETALMDNMVLKGDMFPGIHRLPTERPHPDVANWRKVPTSYISVFGCSQPSIPALRFILEKLADEGYEEVVCVNFREEPIIYLNGNSYCVRESSTLNSNVEHLIGIEAHDIESLEERLRADIYRLAAKSDDNIYVTKEDEKGNQRTAEKIMRGSVKTLATVYRNLGAELKDRIKIKYSRIPITDELAPDERDFDVLIKLIRASDAKHALLFNCQMGRGRTTTGMICACLLYRANLTLDSINEVTATEEAPEYDPDHPNLERGEWKGIMQLVAKLSNGMEVKRQVDEACDICADVQNLRTCILATRETNPDRAHNYLERYWWIIVFNAYINEQQHLEFEATFSEWMNRRWGLRRLLRHLKLE